MWINDFAGKVLGDERAAKAKSKWTRPVKPVVRLVFDCQAALAVSML